MPAECLLVLDKEGRVCFNTKTGTPVPVHQKFRAPGVPDCPDESLRFDVECQVGVGKFKWLMALGIAEDKAAKTAQMLFVELERRFPPVEIM